MSRIDALLTNISLDGVKKPMTIGVSRAFENFDSLDNLETAIEKADAKMYLEKERRKSMLLLRGVQPARLAGVSKSGLAL